MFRTPTTTFAAQKPGTIDLEISDPVLMLNEVARRYETAERVLMEYVDNAVDDAEALYRENGGAYPYPIRIDLTIDREQRAVSVQDNCRGMTRDTLERVVRNVGESQKRGQTWVNGRFGFGVHAFRAAAERIHFQTQHAHGSHFVLELQRDQHRGIKDGRRLDEPFPSDRGTGCLVTVSGFDADWFRGITAVSLQAEIENHFERLLARPDLHITVGEKGEPRLVCRPFDDAAVAGLDLHRELSLEHKGEVFPVTVFLKVAQATAVYRPVSFFARGRRIGEATDIKSFMRKSVAKTAVWGHPHLTGYIEVGEIVQPIINRDDFVRTPGRTLLYEALLPIEMELKTLLSGINQQQSRETLGQVEEAVQAAVTAVVGSLPWRVVFVSEADEGRRVEVGNGRVTINTAHPDFQARARYTRQGNLQPSDRLNAYLATVLALAAMQPATATAQNPEHLLNTQADLIVRLEARLRNQERAVKKR
ncbi:MAG: sensor histidine kinase [Chloroflexi bacterium]|nr:sensor histidine kinase [Chloroflexota bacterium]MBP7044269.1 sensor histidine kinase [Chloroflexota bacterium]